MHVKVTNLKAPWPNGALLGSVVDVGEALPGCFVGKCTPSDEPAALIYEPAGPLRLTVSEPQKAPDPGRVAELEAKVKQLQEELEQERSLSAELSDRIARSEAAAATAAEAQAQGKGRGAR